MSSAGPRVLILDRSLGNHYSIGLARGLDRLGSDVVVAGPAGDRRDCVVAVYPRGGVPGQKVAKSVDLITGGVRLSRVLASFRPQVIHFQWASWAEVNLARVLRRLTSAPLVFTVHNPLPRGNNMRAQLPMLGLADELIVHGPKLREDLLAQAQLDPARVHVVPHGNLEHAIHRYPRAEARARLGLPDSGPVFAFVGQMIARKGVDTLIAAFREHCERGLDGELVFAGATWGVDVDSLRRQAGPSVDRLHWRTSDRAVPDEDLDLVLSAATQVVLPFHEASQSGTVLLAMTHGRCVVTTDIGELPATVGEHGITVPPRDVEALAEALAVASADPERCERLGEAARRHVLAHNDWTASAALTLRVYEAAGDSARAPARAETVT